MEKLNNVDKINYIFKIISSLVKGKYTLQIFCSEWYEKKLFKEFKSPEEALYDIFCNKTFNTWTMEIPDLPIFSSQHKNNFTGECNLENNWECDNCIECNYCVNCKDCSNCTRCYKCNKCVDCIDIRKCDDCECLYNCKHVYNSKNTINKTNTTHYIGKFDGYNIDCNNCVDCKWCIDCDNSTDCIYSYNCDNCNKMNKELTESFKINNVYDLIKQFSMLDRYCMLCVNCIDCSNCNYLYDGVCEKDITIELGEKTF